MISTTIFSGNRILLNKMVEDTLFKITCLLAIPNIILLSYMFIIYWHGLHLFVLQMPFPLIIPCTLLVTVADYIILEKTGLNYM